MFQDTRLVDRISGDHPCLAAFAFRRDLLLLDVAGPWTTRAGASMAIYDAFPDIDGILYASSMDGDRRAYAF